MNDPLPHEANASRPVARPAALRAADEAAPCEVAQFALVGGRCRVLQVDGRVPRHSANKSGGRLRLEYVAREIAHFEYGGHRYALVADEPDDAVATADPTQRSNNIWELLSNRELQIVQLICMGCLTKNVADRLSLSEFTVRSYLKSTYAKLGVRSRGALVFRYAQAFKPSADEP